MFSKKATKIDKIFNVDLKVTTYCQIDVKDFVNFCGLLRKHEIYFTLDLPFIFLRMVPNYEIYLLKNNDLQQLKGKIEFVSF